MRKLFVYKKTFFEKISYADKAAADVQAVSQRVREILQQAKRDVNEITEQQIKQFCKNAAFLTCIRFRSLHEEFKQPKNETLGN